MANNFNPMTGEPVKRNKPLLFAIIGVVVAALVAVLVVGVFEYSEWGKKRKLFKAINNTFQTGAMIEALDASDITKDGLFTVDVDGEVDDVLIDMEIVSNLEEEENYMQIEISGESAFDSEVWIDDDTLELYISVFGDKKFIYNYEEEHDGYLTTIASEYGMNLESFDHSLQSIFPADGEVDKSKIEAEEVMLEFVDLVNDIGLEKVKRKACSVNQKDRNCKGYQMVIDEEKAKELITAYEKLLSVDYSQASSMGTLLGLEGDSLADQFDSMREDLKGMEDITVTFYIYRNQLAEMLMESEGTNVYFEIYGGNRPLDNYSFTIETEEDSLTFEKEGKTSEIEETAEYSFDNQKLLDYTYVIESKDFECKIFGTEDTYTLEGYIEPNKDDLSIYFDKINVNSEKLDTQAEICISNECEINESKDNLETFDLGNASEGEWEILIYDILLQSEGMW